QEKFQGKGSFFISLSMRIGSRSTSNCQRLAKVPGVPGGDGLIPPWVRPTTSSSGRSLPRSRATPIGLGHALWYYSWQTLWLQAKRPKRRNKEVHGAFRRGSAQRPGGLAAALAGKVSQALRVGRGEH